MELKLKERYIFLRNPDKRFWTERLRLYFPLPLTSRNATSVSLLCSILRRGTLSHPDMVSLERAMEKRYGMAVGMDVAKLGDTIVLKATLHLPKGRFTPVGNKLEKDSLHLFSEILFQPLRGEDGFHKEYFEQERRILRAQLSCLINNRELYSRMRFLSHLCPEEPYRLYEYGDEKEVEKLDNKSLFNFYQRLLQETPFIIYTDGLDHDDVLTVLDGLGRNAPAITPFEQKCRVARKRIKKVSEKMDVKQAFLWLGFRADLPPTDERATAAQLLSAIFGGMPTSRLFKTVRLKNSLAYDIYSSYVRSKGILSTFSCVAVENVTATERLIMSEWNKILKGDINDEEISVAKKHIIQDLESLSDSPLALADFYAYGLLLGMKESPERRIASIRRLKRDDIISVAQLFKCDTLFSLLPQKTKPGVSECRK